MNEQESFMKHYVISAFCLKLVDVVVLVLSQVTLDIFLLDWERPPPGKVCIKGQSHEFRTPRFLLLGKMFYL